MTRFIGIIAIAGALSTSIANADTYLFHSFMIGDNEVPPVITDGHGYVLFEFNDVTNMLTILDGWYMDLSIDITVAHVHLAPAGVNGGVVFGLDHTGGTDGVLTGSGVLDAAGVTALWTEGLYVNVHTSNFPGGEIRDQLYLVPAPQGAALIGLGGLLLGRRRRA